MCHEVINIISRDVPTSLNQCYVNSECGSIFSQENISSSHFHTNVNTFGTRSVMYPSPVYEPKELIAITTFKNSQQPLQIHQQDTASTLYSTQMSTSINLIKTEEEVSLSIYPQNEYKPECFNSQNELGMVVIPEEMENLSHKFHGSPINQNYVTYPPTPTTPHTPQHFYDQGHFLLHVANPRNPQLAFSFFAAAADLGSQRGKHQFAYCLQHGIGVVKDEKKAVKIYLEIASADPPNAATLCQLGICFQMGIGVETDASRAVQCYERAVVMGHHDAMFNLAYCLRYGLGTPVNHKRAYELYHRLAELGDPQGMKLLGNCKLAGIGTLKDEAGALEWFRRSSESDIYWGGKMQYALHLLKGINVAQNHVEAFNLVRTVCENFPLSPGPNKLLLGRFYHSGTGCQVDLERALYWYERALRSNYMPSCYVQECEMLIDDIRSRQYQNATMIFLKGVGDENGIIDESIGQDGNC
ncbi:kinase-like domain-containing protein [Rhizophagus clarus]|uniref:Kinase-like domain-containing protein n=1 Tax=Rhizophagus clarus TaxID=94130 RepID=A0A8H3M3J6_9GLOM|nr:kinase-like domain-containing protein [Rhizophagus clarus]